MIWKLSLLILLLLALSFYRAERRGVMVIRARQGAVDHRGTTRGLFIMDRDASTFFKHHSRRLVKSQHKIFAPSTVEENRKRRENFEEQRNMIKEYMEENHNEQRERFHEWAQQWREFNYHGPYLNNRPNV